MSNPNFSAVYSTNNIWRDTDMERCLTDDLDAMDVDIAALESGKANFNHTHDGYAPSDHTHTGYASASDVSQLQTLVGNTSVASQIATAVAGKADAEHTHDQYAAVNHAHTEYANAVHEHTGYIPATESVATSISVTRSTAITLANTEDTTNWAAQVLYYPLLEICFMRIFCTTSETLNADTSYVIGMLADVNYVPENTMPLTVSCGKEIGAYIGPSGNIYVKPYENVYSSTPIRIGGFWFRPNLINE